MINYKDLEIYKQLIKKGCKDVSGSIQQKRGVIQLELPENYKRDSQNAYIIYPETGTIRHLGAVYMPPKEYAIAKSESRNISKLKQFGKLETLEDYDKCFQYIQQLLEKRRKKVEESNLIKTFIQFVNESKNYDISDLYNKLFLNKNVFTTLEHNTIYGGFKDLSNKVSKLNYSGNKDSSCFSIEQTEDNCFCVETRNILNSNSKEDLYKDFSFESIEYMEKFIEDKLYDFVKDKLK